MATLGISSGSITTQNLVPAGVATTGSAVTVDVMKYNTITVQVTGTYTGALSLQLTVDGTNWVTVGGTPILTLSTGAFAATIASASTGIFQADVTGAVQARITGLSAMTGTAVVSISGSEGTALVGVDLALAAGTSTIGNIGTIATSVTPGTAAANLGKAEDAVHTTGDTGVAVWGVRYETQGTAPAAAGDYGFLQIDDLGKQVTSPYAPPVNQVQGTTAAIVNTSDTAVIAAGGAGVRNYITSITMVNSSATATVVELKDGSTVIWRGYVPANGYNDAQFPTPLKGTAATAINVACLTTATNTYVTCTGFRAL